MNNVSFRDSAGFVFKHNGEIYRQINKVYQDIYEKLMSCGLYEELTEKGFLVPHKEINLTELRDNRLYKYIKPEQIDFISYPYEWCFSELKDAAILTLNVQKTALKYNMSLKDASGFNIQFKNGKPIFIDTLSFETYRENTPWIAYGQFCRHFLAPLALMAYTDIRLNHLLITNLDGIPLDLCQKLLPLRAKLNSGLLFHIYLHSLSIKKNEGVTNISDSKQKFSKTAMEALIDSLESCISSLKQPKLKTEWGNYYLNTNYTESSFKEKENIIKEFIQKINPNTICDLGANSGTFSRAALSAQPEAFCIAFDIDTAAVDKNYKLVKRNNESGLLPLILDITNPTPAIGFANEERSNFQSRFKCHTVMALALLHHLAISNNLPFCNIAKFLSELGEYLIIEFIPKDDSKVQFLLSTREDIFENYSQENFEKDFSNFYKIIEKREIQGSKRTIYLMQRSK